MRRIVLPQAARVIVPPLGNEFNNMLKTTSLLVVIGVPELYVDLLAHERSGPTDFQPFELFLACAVWYLLLTTIWGVIQAWIERRLARGSSGSRAADRPARRRLVGLLGAQPRSPTTAGTLAMVETGSTLLEAIGASAESATTWSSRRPTSTSRSAGCRSSRACRSTVKRARGGGASSARPGSGKTTFLRCINHLEKIQAGRSW